MLSSCRNGTNGDPKMLIKIGFDIELAVATPMALIYLLRVHPSRHADLQAPENLQVSGGLVPEEQGALLGPDDLVAEAG